MAPGSGPGARKPIPSEAPEGWKVVPIDELPDGYCYRPDRHHSMHPANKQDPKLRRWLDESLAIREYLDEEGGRLRGMLLGYLSDKETILGAGPVRDPALRDAMVSRAQKIAKMAATEIREAGQRLSTKDAPPSVVQNYLSSRLLPEEVLDRSFTGLDRVGLWATADGLITMTFTGASENERKEWEGLIQSAQRFFGLRKNQGGRPRREEQAESDPRIVARLRRQGRQDDEIARIMAAVDPKGGWPMAHEDAGDDRFRRRVDTYAETGEATLAGGEEGREGS